MVCRLAHLAALLIATAVAPHAGAATETVIANLGVVHAGRNPQAPLVPGPDGAYYGTTTGGGATGNGTVFRLRPPPTGQTEWSRVVLYSFLGGTDGAIPAGALLPGPDGSLFGLAASGGAHGVGVAFQLLPPAPGQTAWTKANLHHFNGSGDGTAPEGALVAGPGGVIYGTTAGGGAANGGVVFSLTPPTAGQTGWAAATLYSFGAAHDGISPTGGLFRDTTTGALFGMTALGGLADAGEIYRLTPSAATPSGWSQAAPAGAWSKTTLYNFRGAGDGNFPVGGLVRDATGIFYGLTAGGGAGGLGTAFSLAPDVRGHAWLETVIYHFDGRLDGASPTGTPVLGADGTLYGVSNGGGGVGSGAAFALSPPAQGCCWTATPLASFIGPNGVSPVGLTAVPGGGFLGVTLYGGTLGNGGGTLFTLTPPAAGGSWTQTVVGQFAQTAAGPAQPLAGLLAGRDGTFTGTASAGGAAGQGAVYALTPPASAGAAWQQTALHSFSGSDGASPAGTLLAGPGGVLYGVATLGGPQSATPDGVVFALIPPAAGSTVWTERVLHAFTGLADNDGAYPASGLVIDSSGALYGTTGSGGIATSDDTTGNGIVYRLAPPKDGHGAWRETVLYRFSGPDGSTPQGSLIFHGNGVLYGTTYTGGAAGEGTVFSLRPPAAGGTAWTEQVLHSFNASVGNDGAIPGTGQLLFSAGGTIWGTASQGGANNAGVVFALSPSAGAGAPWTETLIHSFTGADGSSPYTGLIAGGGGALFGVAAQGGNPSGCPSPFGGGGCGTVFKLLPPAAGGAWTMRVLHAFDAAYGADGGQPLGSLVPGRHGALFGTTAGGGFGGSGTVFEITP